jgi:Xaa-Pro aminopeptidase
MVRLRSGIDAAGVDALLVTALANVRYLTGFSGSAGALLVTGRGALLVTDGRYRTQAGEQLAAAGQDGTVELCVGGIQAQREALAGAVATAAVQRLGLEADHVTWSAKRRWAQDLAPAQPVATTGVVEALRQVKDAGELVRMARAAAIADAALGEVLPLLGQGSREDEVALALDTAMRRLGAEDRAFETIVASGPNAAKPHARPTKRTILAGDPVVVDFGAIFEGYRSDMTRTFCVGGEPRSTLARVFEVVGEAQAAGVGAVRAGVTAGDVDKACRDLIAEAGWKDAFEHGTGHGVGLDIHEAPAVGPGSTAILAPDVVVTVEPGVYLAGIGGVRVEDTVVVTADGCHTLTRFPKDIAA